MYTDTPSRSRLGWLTVAGIAGILLVYAALTGRGPKLPQADLTQAHADEPQQRRADRVSAPELEGGTAWLNTAGPIHLKDLKGKIVILDFWTYCCINCIHTLPDLAKLEKKYANQLVVIGVHSAKFEGEKVTDNIRKAILRYEISHPVVNDAKMKIWDAYDVHSWPTLCVIDPEGNYLGALRGEGNYEKLDQVLTQLIKQFREKKVLNEKPMRFELARLTEKGDSPLFFPGKVLADPPSNRLFIADSTHHRIVVTDLDGKKIDIAGMGTAGKVDGAFDKAQFNDPQGMALNGDVLYVADRKNHSIRALNLKDRTVKTIAGTGEQERGDRTLGGPAATTGLNSPWDLWLRGKELYIAMAGHHQIWVLNLPKMRVTPFAGTGVENILDGAADEANLAQPSGLTSDGTNLYVADSEVSAIRSVSLDGRVEVRTLVGEGLFKFGDVDGIGSKVRLQHALGVTYWDGLLYVADTYNSKIKTLDPKKRECKAYSGSEQEGWQPSGNFYEPGGICAAGDKLYIADTNAHRIRVVDLKTKALRTLELKGVEAPKLVAAEPASAQDAPKKRNFETAVTKVASSIEPAVAKRGQTVILRLTVELAPGWHTYPSEQPEEAAAQFVTKLAFENTPGVVVVGRLKEPPPLKKAEPFLNVRELRFYEGKIVWERPLVIRPDATPEKTAYKFNIQQILLCDKDGCLAPRKIAQEATFTISDVPPVPVDPQYVDEVNKAKR